MDDLEALCSDVTILATGRVVFSGPVRELAAESRELDYRLITSDPQDARRIAADTPGIRLVEQGRPGADEVLVVRALVPDLDALVVRLVRSGIALRELAPVVSPLEAAFLALTEHQGSAGERADSGAGQGEPGTSRPASAAVPRQEAGASARRVHAQQQEAGR
jgi:ABC-2 type transport system ATP-binding protein